MAMQPLALDTMQRLMQREEFPTVQLGASKAVIDWTEGKAKESMEVTVSTVAQQEAILREARQRGRRR